MGDVVVSEFISLDGVIEDPGGSEKTAAGGWAFRFDRGQEGDRFKHEELMAADAQLLGRVTYTATLARSLGELGLVDEYRLMVYPVVLGGGRRLFDGASPRALRLSSSRPAGDCLILTYVPAESA